MKKTAPQKKDTAKTLVGLVTLIGFDGARTVLDMVEEGKSHAEIKKALRPFITRTVNTPKAQRRAHAQRVKRMAFPKGGTR